MWVLDLHSFGANNQGSSSMVGWYASLEAPYITYIHLVMGDLAPSVFHGWHWRAYCCAQMVSWSVGGPQRSISVIVQASLSGCIQSFSSLVPGFVGFWAPYSEKTPPPIYLGASQ